MRAIGIDDFGEVQAARAAQDAGNPFILSTVSVCPIAELPQPIWFQLYSIRDRAFVRDPLAQARVAGLGGTHRRPAQASSRPGSPWDVGLLGRPHHLGNVAPLLGGRTGLEEFFAWMRDNFDSSVTWNDLDAMRADWNGPLIVKDILDSVDTRAAADAGADIIVVSNDGDRPTVFVDGRMRSGLAVVRMLALASRNVLLGRAWTYALAAGVGAGAARMMAVIKAEIRTAMVLTGRHDIASIGHAALAEWG